MSLNAVIGALRVVLGADTTAFEKGMTQAERRMSQSAKKLTKQGEKLKSVGAMWSLAVTAPMAALGAASVKAGSDAAEMQSAFNYTFGSLSKSVEAWAKTTGDSIGRSTYVLQEQALSFQQLFKAAAPTGTAAADLSKQFTLLAQDLSSFYNVSEADALAKLRSGLVGEAEPLRTFGVFLTAAAVEAKALQMGLADTSKELTEQDKILARAALITEATKDAQGDAARTADSFENRTKALNAQLNELGVTIGTAILPALTPLVGALADAAKWFGDLPKPAQSTILVMAGVAAAVGPVVATIGAIATAVGAVLPILPVLGAALVSLAVVGGPILLVSAAVAGVVAVFMNWDKIGPIVGQVVGAVTGWLKDKLGPVLDGAVGAVKAVVDAYVGFYAPIINAVSRLVTGVTGWLQDKLGKVLGWVVEKVKGVSDAFFKLYDAVVGHSFVPDLVKGVGQWFAKLDGLMVNPALSANDEVTVAFEESARAVAYAVDGMVGALRNADWGGAAQGAIDAYKAIRAAYDNSGLGGAIGATAGAIAPYVGGVGGSALSGVAAGASLGSIIPGVGTLIGGAVGGVVGLIGGLFGSSKKKKQEKAQREAQAAAEAQAKAQAEANERTQLQIALLKAQGKEEEALTLERQAQLESVSEANRALQEQVWAEEAAATAAKALADAQAEAAAAQQSAAEDQLSWAQGQLQKAYAAQASALKDVVDRATAARDSLRAFGRDLASALGGDLKADYASASATFRRLAAMAPGDTARLDGLQAASEALLSASGGVNGQQALGYLRDLAAVKIAVKASADAADRQVSDGEKQLAFLDQQVEGLIAVNDSVLQVKTAVDLVAQAIQSLTALTGSSPMMDPQWGAAQNVDANRALALATGYGGAFGGGGFQAYITGASAGAQAAARDILSQYGQLDRIVGFATGGGFEVGGVGGPDSQIRALRLTPGEQVSVSREDPSAQSRRQTSEIAGLRRDMNRLMSMIERNTYDSAKRLKRVVGDGVAVRTNPDEPLDVAA